MNNAKKTMLWIGGLLLALCAVRPSAQGLDVELQRAIQQEIVTGDLRAAIGAYETIASRAGANRAVAAQALLRMAQGHEKLGDGQARGIYTKIVQEYGDLPAASLARTQLAPMDATGGVTPTVQRVLSTGQAHDRVSPDGRYLARPDDANNLVLYEIANGTRRAITSDGVPCCNPDEQYPLAVTFSPDGASLAYEWYFDRTNRSVLRVIGTSELPPKAVRTVYDNPQVDVSPTDWSADGQWIAVLLTRADSTRQIGVVRVADGSLRVLKSVGWSGVGGLRFSPDSRRLAYHRPTDDNRPERDVFVIAIDGSQETVVADSPGDDTVLEWTPDGDHLLVSSDRGGSMSIWSVPASGGKANEDYRLVKSDVGIMSSLGPTRNGTLFYRLLQSDASIYVAGFDSVSGRLTSTPTQPIRQFRGFNTTPEWSSDGKYLAYASAREIPSPINVLRRVVPILSMDTGQVVRELYPSVSYSGAGRWSSDGRLLIARGNDSTGRSGIIKIDAATGATSLVVPSETCSGVPFWAADGRSFFCFQFDARMIAQVDVASRAILHTFPAPGQGAGVSPDGRQIVISGPGRLSALDLSTGEIHNIIQLPASSQVGNLSTINWTPDGRGVVFYGRVQGEEGMWLVRVGDNIPHRIDLNVKPIQSWRFNPVTAQVVFTTNGLGTPTEIWKLEHFLSSVEGAR